MERLTSERARVAPILTQSADLAHIPMLWKVYQDLHIRKRDARVERWVKENASVIRARCAAGAWRDSALLRGYVALHDGFTDEKEIPSSCEVLMDHVLKRGSLPRINTFVDVYNGVSMVTGVSIGAHDTKNIVGRPELKILERDMSFEPIGCRGEGLAKRGEYAYVDEKGVLCRMDIKQCDRTKITEETTDVLVIFQGHEGIRHELLKESIRLLDEVLRTFEIME